MPKQVGSDLIGKAVYLHKPRRLYRTPGSNSVDYRNAHLSYIQSKVVRCMNV